MASSTSPHPDLLDNVTEVAPDELRPEGWTDAELRILSDGLEQPEAATALDRSGTPSIRSRRVVCWFKGHYPVEIWSSGRHHHTECGRCPKRWSPQDAPLSVESHIV